MKILKRLFLCMTTLIVALTVASCAGDLFLGPGMNEKFDTVEGGDNNDYREIIENKFVDAAAEPKSTFALNVSTAAYTNIRRLINEGQTVNRNAVRLEEMVNYFDYGYGAPDEGLKVYGKLSLTPWNKDTKLLTVAVKAGESPLASKAKNVVFLVDTSGSMYGADRLDLAKKVFELTFDGLAAGDKISLVTYASGCKTLLSGIGKDQRKEFNAAMGKLKANGATSGEKGLETAYAVAARHFIDGGNNRVILASDGDFNVGISQPDQLKEFIQTKKKSGIALSVMGFGYGNYHDSTMEVLANYGGGTAYYIDGLSEAERVTGKEFNAAINDAAADAKAQVVFNPETVESYRLLGYEHKLLNNEDWDSDEADAGVIGSGKVVVALYEIKLKSLEGEICTASVRYKLPGTQEVKEDSASVKAASLGEGIGEDEKFIACVAEFALVLLDSAYKGEASLENILTRLGGLDTSDYYRGEFKTLVAKYYENAAYKPR